MITVIKLYLHEKRIKYTSTAVKKPRAAESVMSADILETQKSVCLEVISGYWRFKVQMNLSNTATMGTEESGC